MIIKYLFIIFMILALSACEKVYDPVTPPPKPDSVPMESIWVGGLDGGVFINMKLTESSPVEYWGEIHYISGDLSYRGNFLLLPKSEDGFEIDNPSVYQAWDGDTIYLSDNRQLRVIE